MKTFDTQLAFQANPNANNAWQFRLSIIKNLNAITKIFILNIFFTLTFFNNVFSEEVKNEKVSKKEQIGVKFFMEIMGNVHQNPSRYSQVLTTLSCNHPVKIMKEISIDGKEMILFGEDKWNLVNVGPYTGYIMKDFLSESKNDCFEEAHSKFFEAMNLDINDLYYFARLYDQYVQVKTKAFNK